MNARNEALLNRLMSETLIKQVLASISMNELAAQSALDALAALPKYPVTDDDIRSMFHHRRRMYEAFRTVDFLLNRKLPKYIKFYMSTY